jgi:3-oxoacyl-[acyl-carrier protein] reductase
MISRKIAIITGVSRLKGIGRSICIELAKKDFDIFFTYWTDYDKQMPWGIFDNEPDMIENEIRKLGVNCHKIELDLSINESIDILLNAVDNKMGFPSILINNATYSTSTNIDNLTASELDKHYAINLRATTLLTTGFIKRFKFASGGRIISLTSGQSLGQMSDEIAYAITKGAIETLTYTLSNKAAQKGITINAVNPGPTDSGWMDAELRNAIISKTAMNRIGMPIDAARLIGFLASDEAEWITGQVIHSEGGFTR